jgi:hypothetical protein
LLTARGLLPDIRTRLARYYDELFIDEVQDFAGHDFNFLLELCRAEVCAAAIFISIPLTQATTVTSMQRCMTT